MVGVHHVPELRPDDTVDTEVDRGVDMDQKPEI